MIIEKKELLTKILIFLPVTIVVIFWLSGHDGLIGLLLRPLGFFNIYPDTIIASPIGHIIASIFSLVLLVIFHLIKKVKKSLTFYILFILVNGLLSWAVVMGLFMWWFSGITSFSL